MIDLLKFRKDKKYDQKHISAVTGLDQAVISKYENKKLVTNHITETLLSFFPELESYMITQSGIAAEEIAEYASENKTINKMIDSIYEIIQSNQKLIDNNTQLIDINADLSNFLIQKLSEM